MFIYFYNLIWVYCQLVYHILQKKFCNDFPNIKFYRLPKWKSFFCRKFFRWVENAVRKGKIACYKQFLLFPLFSKDLYCRHVKTRACLGKSYAADLFAKVVIQIMKYCHIEDFSDFHGVLKLSAIDLLCQNLSSWGMGVSIAFWDYFIFVIDLVVQIKRLIK